MKNKKEKYIQQVNEFFKDKKDTLNIFINQIETFYKINSIYKLPKHNYKIGDMVYLRKGTFLHGARDVLDRLQTIRNEGIISNDFVRGYNERQKTPWCASMWNIQRDMNLREYIELYSGATITFRNADCSKEEIKLVKYNEMDKTIRDFTNTMYWRWQAEQTKECRFMPCLTNNKVEVAFILNTASKEAKELIKNDIFNLEMDETIVRSFIFDWFCNDFIYTARNALTTDRESAILFGMPACFIEGILVGKKYEQNECILKKIKDIFSNCYICNLDGKVLIV